MSAARQLSADNALGDGRQLVQKEMTTRQVLQLEARRRVRSPGHQLGVGDARVREATQARNRNGERRLGSPPIAFTRSKICSKRRKQGTHQLRFGEYPRRRAGQRAHLGLQSPVGKRSQRRPVRWQVRRTERRHEQVQRLPPPFAA